MSEHYVTCNVDDHISAVTIDRPPVNAFDPKVRQQPGVIFQDLQATPIGGLFEAEVTMEGVLSFLEKRKTLFKGK